VNSLIRLDTAAALLGMSLKSLRKLGKAGVLQIVTIRHRMLVTGPSIERYLRERVGAVYDQSAPSKGDSDGHETLRQ
jgi:hypothetical protein